MSRFEFAEPQVFNVERLVDELSSLTKWERLYRLKTWRGVWRPCINDVIARSPNEAALLVKQRNPAWRKSPLRTHHVGDASPIQARRYWKFRQILVNKQLKNMKEHRKRYTYGKRRRSVR